MNPYMAHERPGETDRPDASNRLHDSEFWRCQRGSGTASGRLPIAPGRRGDAGARSGADRLATRRGSASADVVRSRETGSEIRDGSARHRRASGPISAAMPPTISAGLEATIQALAGSLGLGRMFAANPDLVGALVTDRFRMEGAVEVFPLPTDKSSSALRVV
jgi:hypothetical protein